METEPWNIISHLFPDLVLLVEGKKLYYHQAVLAQHSQLVRSFLLKTSCCKCKGVDCSRNAGNVFITLDGVKTDTVQYVMDMIYAGSGNIAGDTEDYKCVLDMLQINTIVVDALNSFEGFILDEIFSQEEGNDVTDGTSSLNDALEEESRKVDQELKETNKALKKLEREKKKLAIEEKKKQEVERKRERRSRTRKPMNAEENSRDGLQDNAEDAMEVEETQTVEKVEPTRSDSVVIQNSKTTSDTANQPTSVAVKFSNTQPSTKISDDDDCEIIIDSEVEKKNSSVEVKAEEVERYVCPFKDCRSESKNAQSIKVHLALVHYKKSIQSEFPNWKKQKCDECEKSFGQMTAYYLHMANHKKYQYMELPAHAMVHKDEKSAAHEKLKQSSTKSFNSNSAHIRGGSTTQTPTPKSSSSTSIAPSSTSTVLRTSGTIIKPSSLGHARSNSFVQGSSSTQATKSSTVPAILARSKSFVQTKAQQPQITSSKLQSLIARTSAGSKTSIGSSSATFGRPSPPGPPGPSNVSSTRSNSLNRNSSPFSTSNMKSSTPGGPPSPKTIVCAIFCGDQENWLCGKANSKGHQENQGIMKVNQKL